MGGCLLDLAIQTGFSGTMNQSVAEYLPCSLALIKIGMKHQESARKCKL